MESNENEFLVSASEFVVCGTETVPFRRRIPETAAVDVDGAAGGSVAALGGVLHDFGTALVAVVPVASPQCCLGTNYWLKFNTFLLRVYAIATILGSGLVKD